MLVVGAGILHEEAGGMDLLVGEWSAAGVW